MIHADFLGRTKGDRETPEYRDRSPARPGACPVETAEAGQALRPVLPVCREAVQDQGSFPGSGWDRVGVIWPRDEII